MALQTNNFLWDTLYVLKPGRVVERELYYWMLDLTGYQLHAIYDTTQNQVCCDWL